MNKNENKNKGVNVTLFTYTCIGNQLFFSEDVNVTCTEQQNSIIQVKGSMKISSTHNPLQLFQVTLLA